MSKIIFDSGISLDGFFAGDNRSPSNPIGNNGQAIHNWMYKQKAFWKNINMEGGEEYGADSKLIDDVFARTGSYIMGKRMFEEGEVHWAEDLYKADVYVMQGLWTNFSFTLPLFFQEVVSDCLTALTETNMIFKL